MSVRPFIEVVSGPARASVATETIAGILRPAALYRADGG